MTNTVRRDTGVQRALSLPAVNVQDKALSSWIKTVTERLEVREGLRGNEAERAVTVRELRQQLGGLQSLAEAANAKPKEGEVLLQLAPGFTATVEVDQFAQRILDSRLFKQLTKDLDDPTRFDHLAQEIRQVLQSSIAEVAAARGAAVQQIQTIMQSNQRSLAMVVQEVTASLSQSASGIRSTQAAFADGQRAMVTNVLQLQSSLGNYYQDGGEGRASLEQEMHTLASHSEGLRAQYTLKVQAGGALAGYGVAAEEVNGKASSAFIISADKFAIVTPSYTGGLLTTPRPQDVVFGVDANGIYLQNNVYLKGNLRVDGTGKTLDAGLRGSLMLTGSGAWSDTTARQTVWSALGKAGSASNSNHLVIGDMVTLGGTTRHWNGTSWVNPGAVFNGDLLVDGTVAARAINTNGLTVRDNSGNIILSASGMDASWLKNLKASQVTGLGALATRNAVTIGSTVNLPDGTVLGTSDFVNRLSRISSGNIGNFMDVAAIGSAYIGNAAVGSLQIAGNAVTVPVALSVPYEIAGNGAWQNLVTVYMYLDQPGLLYMNTGGYVGYGSGWTPVMLELKINGQAIARLGGDEGVVTAAMSGCVSVGAGSHTIQMNFMAGNKARVAYASIFAMGVKR